MRRGNCLSIPSIDQVPKLIELNFDVIIIDLDSDPETALDLVEGLCADSAGNRHGVFHRSRTPN